MNAVRYILIGILILLPCFLAAHFTPTHHAEPDNPFLPLFEHLMPAPLVSILRGPHRVDIQPELIHLR